MNAKFGKRKDKWVIESDSYLKRGTLVQIKTAKGDKTVAAGAELEKPHGVQRRGCYVYEVA